jgi:hypothetical protein
MAPVDRAAWAQARETVHTRRSTNTSSLRVAQLVKKFYAFYGSRWLIIMSLITVIPFNSETLCDISSHVGFLSYAAVGC